MSENYLADLFPSGDAVGKKPAGEPGVPPPKKSRKDKPKAAVVMPDLSGVEMPSEESLAEVQADIHAKTSGKDYSAETETAAAGPEVGPSGPEAERLTEVKENLKKASDEYAKIYGQARARRKWFQKILDVNVEKGKKNQDVIDARKKFLEAREAYIKESVRDFREKSGGESANLKLIEAEMKIFTDELMGKSLTDLHAAKNDRAIQYNIDRGWLAKSVADPYMRMSRWISKRPWYVQVAIYGSLLGVGALGAITGVAGLSYGAFALGAGLRVARAGAAGEGMRGLTQSAAQWYRDWKGRSDMGTAAIIAEQSGVPAERRDSVEGRLEHLEAYLLRENEKMEKRLVRREGGDRWRRRIGIFAGAFVGSGGLGYMIGGLGIGGKIRDYFLSSQTAPSSSAVPKGFSGGPPMVESGTKPSGVFPAETKPGRFSGSGLEHTGHGEFSGDFAEIKKGGNIWRSTREIFIKHPGEYGYSDEEAQRLFKSFKGNGNLRRLGIRGIENFSDLSEGQKHKIWAEWKTATAIQDYKVAHGGRITDLIHPGDSVRLDEHGKLFLDNTSKIKAGYLSDVQRPRGGGAAAYEPGGKGAVDTSEFDRQIEEARGRGLTADERLKEIRGPIAAQLAEEAELTKAVDVARTEDLMDFIQSKIYGPGTNVDWQGPARLFREKMLGQFITSDQPMGPPANVFDQQQNWRAAQILNNKLGPTIGNESTQDWLMRGITENRVSPEEVIRTLKRVVNG